MAIEITCECGKGYRVSDDKAGEQFQCRECGRLVNFSTDDFLDFVEDVLDDEDPNEARDVKPAARKVRPPGKLVSKFYGTRSVTVDFSSKTILFENCHTPRKFFALHPKPHWSCPATDLRAVHRVRIKNTDTLTIVTRTGSATVPSSASNYEALQRCLEANLPDGGPSLSADHPAMVGVYALVAGLGGLFAALFLTPRNAPDHLFGWFWLGGTLAGFVIVFLIASVARLSDSEEDS